MLLRIPLFIILLTMTSSAFAVMSAQEVRANYEVWMRCHGTDDPSCPPCEDISISSEAENAASTATNVCLPDRREAEFVFSGALLSEERRARDRKICDCFAGGRAGPLEGYSFQQGSTMATAAVLGFASEDERAAFQNGNVTLTSSSNPTRFNQVRSRLFDERALTALSAMSYTRDPSDASRIGGRYSFVPEVRPTPTVVTGGAGGIFAPVLNAGATVATFYSQVLDAADAQTISDSVLNSTGQPDSVCIPYRTFLASKQMPSPQFFSDLQATRSFNPNEWNYSIMVDTYRRVKAGRDDEQLFRENPEMEVLYRRMKFLHNNPVLKNIFQSGDTTQMQRTYDLVKTMPRPCTEISCSRDPVWLKSMQNYRRDMMGLLRDPPVIAAAGVGAERARGMILSLETLRQRANTSTSDIQLGTSASIDASGWNNFCLQRDQISAVEVYDSFEDAFGKRLPNRQLEDREFRTVNKVMCETSRRNPQSGVSMKFTDFLSTTCPDATRPQRCTVENRTDLVAEYMNLYSEISDPDDVEIISSIMPYIEGELKMSSIPSSEVVNLNTIAASSEQRSQPFEYSESGVPNFTSSLSKNVTKAPAGTGTPNSQTAQTPERLQGTPGNTAAQADPFIVPIAPPAETPATPEAAQAELAEGEEESQRIRDEISSLRDVMRRDPQNGGPRDSQALTDLNQRLAGLERRLRERERENSELRDQIADAQTSTTTAAQRVQAQTSAGGEVRRSGPGAAQPVAQGGAAAGSSIAAPVAGNGPGQLSSVSGRTAGASLRPVISSGNAALLSKYGVQSGSVQGALIVANPSTAIDYQALRSQSEGSVLSLPLPIEEYNLIASNNQEALRPYLEQCRALAGSVCRLNISSPGTSNQLELFVVKNGNEVSIIPTNSPDRRPAALPTGARVFTLNELQNELQGR